MGSKDAHPTEIVLMSPTCYSCGEYRIKHRKEAYEKYKRGLPGEFEPLSMEDACSRHSGSGLSKHLPSDYWRVGD